MKRLLSALLCASLLLLPGCQKKLPPPEERLVEETAWTAPDGTAVSLWDTFSGNTYCLPDGTELLYPSISWPWDTTAGGLTGFSGMEPAAQKKVRTYYEDRGLLFDMEERISVAYTNWQDCQAAGQEFRYQVAQQRVNSCYETERHIGFVTTVLLSPDNISDPYLTSSETFLLFDRATGELVDPWALFTVSQEEALDTIIGQYAYGAPSLRDAVRDAELQPEWMIFRQTDLTLEYPAGALAKSGIENGYSLSVDYKDLADILHPWAIPAAPET